MAGDWEDFRKELDSIQVGNDSVEDLNAVTFLRSAGEAAGSSIGLGEQTLRFLLETEPSTKGSEAFEDRLVETMRLAAQIREFSVEARTLLQGRHAFGHALRQMIETHGARSPMTVRELEKIESAQRPQNIGATTLGEIVKQSGLNFLRVFCLTAYALEKEYSDTRSSLASEGIARTDRAISKRDRQKQSVDVAAVVLKPKRVEALSFLVELTRMAGNAAT